MDPAPTLAAPTVKGGPFFFPDLLRRELAASARSAKTVRTRTRLQIAVAELLQESGFHALTISDVCRKAECGHGTFYNYWPNREAIALDVLTRYNEEIRVQRPRANPSKRSLFDRLVAGHAYYIETHRLNAGLARCMVQLSDERSDFSSLGLKVDRRLAERVVNAFEREDPAQMHEDRQRRVARALACIAMVDHLLYSIDSRKLNLGIPAENIAQELATIWYRAFCGRDPFTKAR